MTQDFIEELNNSLNRQRSRLTNDVLARKLEKSDGTANLVREQIMLGDLHLNKLRSCELEYMIMQEHFREVQRAWLTLMGFCDYVMVYQRKLLELGPDSQTRPAGRVIGAFVDSVPVAWSLVQAGIPCYLVRPVSQYGATKVLTLTRPRPGMISTS